MMMLPKMVDMVQSREEATEGAMPSNDYPYGLCLRLTEAELDKLNLPREAEVGDMIHIFALAKVTSVSQHSREGSENCCVELQITHLGVEDEDEEDEAEDKEM